MKYTREFSVGLVILVAAGLLIYMSIAVGSLRVKSGHEHTLFFDDATGLVNNAPVLAAGIKVGVVSELRFENGGAVVGIAIDRDVALKRDATAVIRARSLLGEKFVAIDPGKSDEPLGDQSMATLPQQDPILFTARLSELLDSMDPENLAGLVEELQRFMTGAEGEKPLSQLVRELAATLQSLAESSEAFVEDGHLLVKDGKVLVGKGKALLDDGQGLIGPGRSLIGRASEAVGSVQRTSDRAYRTLESLDPAVEDLSGVIGGLRRVTVRLESLMRKMEGLSSGELARELRRIVQEEGIYIRLRPVKGR